MKAATAVELVTLDETSCVTYAKTFMAVYQNLRSHRDSRLTQTPKTVSVYTLQRRDYFVILRVMWKSVKRNRNTACDILYIKIR